jgi:hypothetical protein
MKRRTVCSAALTVALQKLYEDLVADGIVKE